MASVVLDNLAESIKVEDILKSYPSLSRESVQAVIAYAAELARERVVALPESITKRFERTAPRLRETMRYFDSAWASATRSRCRRSSLRIQTFADKRIEHPHSPSVTPARWMSDRAMLR